jgi:TfoX/Sxy family transcriptional regulator of competence genes
MAFDTGLAERLRDALAATGAAPTEKKMFGGLSFLIQGNMCCGVMGDDLLVRVGPGGAERALTEPATRPFDMGRGPSPGWVIVTSDGVASDEALGGWVDRALAFVATLPAK